MPNPSPSRFALLALLPLLSTPPAAAFTPEEVAAAAEVARQVEDDVRALAADALGGRASGTTGHAQAQELLIDELEASGLPLGDPLLGRDAYRQPFDALGTPRANLLAKIPGGALADEYVIVGAHYDHPPSLGCRDLGDGICNGATDNAAGVAVVLAIGRALLALPEPPARTVVLALWDAEEDGLLGSDYFVDHPLVPLADVSTYLNFDIQGANLAPSVREVSFAVGAESGGATLQDLTREAIEAVGLDTRLLSLTFGQNRSDYVAFYLADVPIVFFSDATNACYHTTRDDVDVVDFGKLARQAEIGFRLALEIAEREEPIVDTPIGYIATYEDLLALSTLLTSALADLEHVLPPYDDQLVALEELARQRVEAGPGAFTGGDAVEVAIGAIDITTNGLPCDPLLLPEPDGASAALAGLAALACAASRARRPLREPHR